jgi:hypothetical protein
MDPKALRAEALEETARFFLDKLGHVPDPDSDEFEVEYRRQFARAQQRQARSGPAAPMTAARAALDEERLKWAELQGLPAEQRWANTLRDERMAQISRRDLRAWLGQAWATAQDWLATRDMPLEQFMRKIEAQFASHRQRYEEQAKAALAARQAKAVAALAIKRKIQAAGVTAQGLSEMVDASNRAQPAALKDKLAEFTVAERNFRVFESANPRVLMVLEKTGTGTETQRLQYAIERDDGLAADLRLFAEGEGG